MRGKIADIQKCVYKSKNDIGIFLRKLKDVQRYWLTDPYVKRNIDSYNETIYNYDKAIYFIKKYYAG